MKTYKTKVIIKDKSLERKEFVLYNDALACISEVCKLAIECGADEKELIKKLKHLSDVFVLIQP